MTKDLAVLIGPDQPWLTTEQFLAALASGLKRRSRAETRRKGARRPLPARLSIRIDFPGAGGSGPARCACSS